MSRDIDFRYHGYSFRSGIRHNLLDLVLCEIASVRDPVIFDIIPSLSDGCLLPHGTEFGQLRVSLDLHPPALVIGKMPVEGIHLVDRHDVQVLLYLINPEEMPCHIQMHSSISETRSIIDLHTRNTSGLIRKLIQGLPCIKETVVRRCLDNDLLTAYGDHVGFVRQAVIVPVDQLDLGKTDI